MNKNFSVRDAVFFESSDDTFDIRGDCELIEVQYRPGISASVEMIWKIRNSNQHLQMLFTEVRDFIFRGRDTDYPAQSGTMLGIAGFSGRDIDETLTLYVEPEHDMSYMTFVMDDMSAVLIDAEKAVLRRL